MPVVPNGVACVAAALEHAGHDGARARSVLRARSASPPRASAAQSFAPDVIGLSVRNIDNSDLVALEHYTPAAASLLATLRDERARRAQVIAGGAAFGVAPEALFDELGVEHAVAGDGERATHRAHR